MKSGSKRLLYISIGLALILSIFVVLLFPTSPGQARIHITIRTNGIPYLMGIPLKTGSTLRNATFHILAWSQLPVKAEVEPHFQVIFGSEADTNLWQVFKDLDGLKVNRIP